MLTPKLRELFKNNDPLVESVLSHYALYARPDHPGMIFTNPNQPLAAQEFLRWLINLGLKTKDISFVSYDKTTNRSELSAAWRKALGLHPSVIIVKSFPPNGRQNWACPWLGITPTFEDKPRVKSGSAGFRFLMVMAIIAYKFKTPPVITVL